MIIVSTSYSKTESYADPVTWLERIDFYTGILEELSARHIVYGIERINYEGSLEKNGVHYIFIRLKNKISRFPWHMHRIIRKTRPDVVMVNGFIFPLQIIQLRMTLGSKVKIIVLHRAEKPGIGVKLLLQKLADKFVDAYLFTSAEIATDWLNKNIISNPGKIHEVIQASSHFKPTVKTATREKLSVSGSPVFLWVGRLDKNKDPLTVIKAFIAFQNNHEGARLYMVYQEDNLLQSVQQLIAQNATGKTSITLVGKVPHADLQDWYNAADYIISGSHYEGSGISVSEAMSCGCIPVVTNIPSFRKMTGPGLCGFLFEAGNDTALLRVLESAIKSDIEEERSKTLNRFENELSFKAIANKIENLLH